ncbi:MAG: 50S ribosomal protein L29 [Acidobacteriota bacterium]|jgi:large subunit ribosomal protein L29
MMKLKDLRKTSKVREQSVEELQREAEELREQLMKLRFQMSSGQVENPIQIRDYRHGLARVETILAEKLREERAKQES